MPRSCPWQGQGAGHPAPNPKRCVPPRGSHLGVLQVAEPQGLTPWVSPGFILAPSPLGDLLGDHVCRTAASSQLVATGYGSPSSTPTLMGPDSSVHTQAIFSLAAVFRADSPPLTSARANNPHPLPASHQLKPWTKKEPKKELGDSAIDPAPSSILLERKR